MPNDSPPGDAVPIDCAAYIRQMESVLALKLDDARRAELLAQFERIAAMAAPLMAFPLDDRLDVAGVYKA
ncbi:oxalurate catabolism protein HpxX [Sodalis sp. RH23]|uniref:oxalurate catabolism protein HpxX n=1 Tax=unclassified Sodalis (in: enterobacteria) TaxID=2636512 RepID=UPI0039B427CC